MISISTLTYDINGVIWFHSVHPSNAYQAKRRGSITATLDGGVSVYDAGHSEADTEFSIVIKNCSQNQMIQMKYLVTHYNVLRFCSIVGVFDCVISFYSTRDNLYITARILEKIS